MALTTGFIDQTLVSLAQSVHYDDMAALALIAMVSAAYLSRGRLWAKPDSHLYKFYERPQQAEECLQVKKISRNLSEVFEEATADVVILWASQSGTAESLAARLAKDLSRQLSVKTILLDISSIDPASCAAIPSTKLAIFIASTYGEGDPSNNCAEFWSWLNQSDKRLLQDLRYICFGLGNSKYKFYSYVIDFVDQKLHESGAQALMPAGRGDDALGATEEDFLEWKTKVFDLFQDQFGYSSQTITLEPNVQIEYDESLHSIDLHHGVPNMETKSKSAQSNVFPLPIVESRELLRVTNGRNCIHMEVELPDLTLRYKTGDHIGIWPVNPSDEVERLIRVLGLEDRRATAIRVKSLDGTVLQVPSPSSINALFEHYLEICALPSREHIGTLAALAANSAAKQLLKELSTSKTAYQTYLESKYVTLGRLLELTGSWTHLDLGIVVEMLRPMQPRYYSISSSSIVHARKVSLTAMVADSVLPITNERIRGLATNYLLSSKPQQPHSHPGGMSYSLPLPSQPLTHGHLHALIRRTTFKLPILPSAPIVMVAAGTGIAPFRGFVQERARLASMGREVGPTKLFFGCRNADEDFLYRSEFETFVTELGDSFSLVTAFSRPNDYGTRQYVQDRILEDAEELHDLLFRKNAYFYVCGSAAMARGVNAQIENILMQKENRTENEAREYFQIQKKKRRWMQDVWG